MLNKCLTIEFDNSLKLEWEIYSDSLSQRWSNALKKQIDSYGVQKFDLFNFANDAKQYHYDEMKKSAEILKKVYKSEILNIPPLGSINTVYLNELHNWFADNQLILEEKDKRLGLCLDDMHKHLHSLEGNLGYVPSPIPQIKFARIEATVIPLEDDDYNRFGFNIEYGNIHLTYHHIGKGPMQIHFSEDRLDDSVFVPHTNCSTDFVINFGSSEEYDNSNFWEWFDKNYEWFKSRTNWSPRDPKLANGVVCVAKLITDISKEEIINSVSLNSKVTKFEVV